MYMEISVFLYSIILLKKRKGVYCDTNILYHLNNTILLKNVLNKMTGEWHSALLLDKSLAQPWWEKLPFAADENRYRDPHLHFMQRIKELQAFSPKEDVFINSLRLGLRKPFGRGGRKSARDRADVGHQGNKAFEVQVDLDRYESP